MGEFRAKEGYPQLRIQLPKMRESTKEWYIKTYRQECYDRYWGAMENLDVYREYDPEKHFYSHRAFHDAESFVWVIVNELIRAWPEGYEEELTDIACRHITTLEQHEFGEGADPRIGFFDITVAKWKSILHSRLAFLAPMLDKLVTYFKVEWQLWPEHPEDHGHEFVKVYLREAILDMKERNDSIPLNLELRTPKKHDAAIRSAHKVCTPEVTSPSKQGSKRPSAQQGSKRKRSRMTADDNENAKAT